MKLWIDDFRKPPDPSWVWAQNLQEAVDHYKKGGVKIISFDHDLGILVTLDSSLEESMTTMPLARMIEEDAYKGIRPPMWTIHSMNPVGRKNLHATLTRANQLYRDSLNKG